MFLQRCSLTILSNNGKKFITVYYDEYMRIWDKEGRYKDGSVKEYQHWILEVSFRQHTFGCFIIFAKRSVGTISALDDAEIIELKTVMQELETTLAGIAILKPDRMNYLQMGNGLHHLHFHAIPRYATVRTFMGKEWHDETFGHPPVWSNTEVEKDLVIKIKEIFLQNLKP
jgi:diadenosine tetraphosphate (Ap4A) HIT family hydrolase